MKRIMTSLPIPICGLFLGIVSLGNLYKLNSHILVGNIIGSVGMFLLLIMAIKIVAQLKSVLHSLTDMLTAAVAPTFPMAPLVSCTYLDNISGAHPFVTILWYLAVLIELSLVGYFAIKFVIIPTFSKFNVYPSWLIPFVGIGVITVTSANFNPLLGQIMFWLTFLGYVILFPTMIYRIFVVKHLPQATLPLITIIAAPAALTLEDYLLIFPHPNLILANFLLLFSQANLILALFLIQKSIRGPFYPSFSAFTFPLVLCGASLSLAAQTLHPFGPNSLFLSDLSTIETALISIVIAFVFVRYWQFIWQTSHENKNN